MSKRRASVQVENFQMAAVATPEQVKQQEMAAIQAQLDALEAASNAVSEVSGDPPQRPQQQPLPAGLTQRCCSPPLPAALAQTVGEASKAIKDGFSTYRLMLRRRRRRLAREASLHVELKGEEILEATEEMEGYVAQAEGGEPAATPRPAAAAASSAGGSSEPELTEDEIFDLVEELEEDEAEAMCEDEGIDSEGLDLDDMKAELIEHLTEKNASSAGGEHFSTTSLCFSVCFFCALNN